jgi:hypothetical protein
MDTSMVFVGPSTRERPLLRLTEPRGRTGSRTAWTAKRIWEQQPDERPDSATDESDDDPSGQPTSSSRRKTTRFQDSASSTALAATARNSTASLVSRYSVFTDCRLSYTDEERQRAAKRADAPSGKQCVAKAAASASGSTDAAGAVAFDADDPTRPADVQHHTDDDARPNHQPKAKGRCNLEILTDRSLGETKVAPDYVPQRDTMLQGVMNCIAEKDHNNGHSTQSAGAKGVQDLGPYTVTNGVIELCHDYRDNNHNNREDNNHNDRKHDPANRRKVSTLASAMRK